MRKKFQNPHIPNGKRSLKDVFLWKMGYFQDEEEEVECPSSFRSLLPSPLIDPSQPIATWVNHSTFFLKVDQYHILTDPIWSHRCSPIPFLGPKRRHLPGLALEDLGKVDIVLISHNHYDHLDKQTVLALHRLYPNIEWCVPLGVKKWFLKLGITKVTELGWWDEIKVKSFSLTAVPAQHFSGRTFKDLDRTLWVGYVLESLLSDKRVYFVGDTGYNEVDFKNVGMKWPHMDLSLIPIGTYIPKRFMSPVHIGPFEAVKIHQEVNSKRSIGMHWKTFRLSDEEEFRPSYDLSRAIEQAQIDPSTFLALPPGYEINW